MAEGAKPPKAPVPWDAKLAADAAMAEHCKNLGGVVLKPPRQTGFGEGKG